MRIEPSCHPSPAASTAAPTSQVSTSRRRMRVVPRGSKASSSASGRLAVAALVGRSTDARTAHPRRHPGSDAIGERWRIGRPPYPLELDIEASTRDRHHRQPTGACRLVLPWRADPQPAGLGRPSDPSGATGPTTNPPRTGWISARSLPMPCCQPSALVVGGPVTAKAATGRWSATPERATGQRTRRGDAWAIDGHHVDAPQVRRRPVGSI